MFKYKYKVENINSDIIIGSIENIAKNTKQTPYNVLVNIYDLNKSAHVNLKNFFGRYVSGNVYFFSKDKKKFLVFKFKAYFFRNKKAIRKFFIHYLGNPCIFIPMIFSEIMIKYIFDFKQFSIATLFTTAIFFSVFIHEVGHFLTACYFDTKCAFLINSFYYSVIYETEDNKKSLLISLMGPSTNLFAAFLLVILKIFITNNILNMLCCLGIIVNLITAINILPCFKDGNNIMKELKVIMKKREGNT